MNYKKTITQLTIKDFKRRYSDLDVTKLIPKKPLSLENVNLERKEMTQLDINPVSLSTICGTVLGDSNLAIAKSYANARIQCRHSTRQTDWFMWKALCALKPFLEESSISFQLPDGKQRSSEKLPGEILGKWKFSTRVHEELTKLRNIIAPNNKKTVARSWLNHMNDYFLMALWLDDGSLSKGRQGVISVNEMPLAEAEILANYITNVWGVSCKVSIIKSKATNTNPEPVQIEISDQDNLEKFLRIIAPIVPVESMLYKVCFCPLDSSRQQRWASELKTLIREEWHDTIEKYLAYELAMQESDEKKPDDSKPDDSEEDIVQEH
jgi:hypothetical protein